MASSKLSKANIIIIHDDIIIDHILSKLPPKPLIRFQCVSKLWKSIISNPSFKISPKYITRALFITTKFKSPSYDIPKPILLDYKLLKNDNLSIPLRLEEPHGPIPSLSIDHFWGSCNGLVLFSIDWDFFLWNPTTSYCQKVRELNHLDNAYSYTTLVSGFCYDEHIEDYVVLACFRGSNLPVISSTLKSKRWRGVPFPYDIDSVTEGVTVNNLIHWLASEEGGNRYPNTIIYYDATSNGFNELPSPDPIEGFEGFIDGIGVLDDCICMMRLNGCDVEVLVMKEYGVRESWTTMFCIPQQHESWITGLLLCSWKMDVILLKVSLFKTSVEYVYAYYPRTRKMEKIEVPGPRDCWVTVIPCVETLVSPTQYYWNEEI